MSEELTKADLPDLQDDLFKVRQKWYDIGLRIGLTSTDLDPIKAQYRDDFKDCLLEMLKLRLTRLEKFTKKDIVLALQRPSLSECSLAADLEQKYGLTPTMNRQETNGVCVNGSEAEVDSMLDKPPTEAQLVVIRWKDSEHTDLQRFRLKERICNSWYSLGEVMGFEYYKLESWKTDNRDIPMSCCSAVLNYWFANGSDPPGKYPVTWKGLIDALTDVGGFAEVIKEFEHALCKIVAD